MYPGYNSHDAFRRSIYPDLPEVTDDNHWHLHYRRELERQKRVAVREAMWERLKAKVRLEEQYRQNQKVMEDEDSGTRSVIARREEEAENHTNHDSPASRRSNFARTISHRRFRASPLFRLPAAVRDKIFTHVLTSPHPVPIKKHTAVQPEYTRNKMFKVSWRWFPPLLKVSRQVEAEAAPVFYRVSTFELKMRAVEYDELSKWIAGTGASLLAEVKLLTVVIEPTCFGDLQAIVEAKPNGGLRVIAEEMAATVNQGLPNAKVQVEGPKRRFKKALKVDVARAGLDKAVANGIWKEWKAEVDNAFGAG